MYVHFSISIARVVKLQKRQMFVCSIVCSILAPLCDAARACCGEFIACLLRVPVEVVKQNAQVSAERSALSVARRLYKQHGARRFYRGFATTLSREIPFAFIEYPLWEFLKRKVANRVSFQLYFLSSDLILNLL